MAAEIADDIFPLDFHIYEIKCPENCWIQIGVETIWQVIDGSFSGDKKIMKQLKKLFREIYLYYGVTNEDIKNETERYKSLLAALCHRWLLFGKDMEVLKSGIAKSHQVGIQKTGKASSKLSDFLREQITGCGVERLYGE